MEACRPVSRRSSLGGSTFAAPDQQPCRPSSSAKSKRHSWSFTNIGGSSRSRDVSPRRKDQAPCLSPSSSFVSRSRPSSQGTSLSAPRMPEPGPEPLPERPRSSHGFKLHLPLVSRNHPPRSSTLPTIMEQRGTFAAESLRSRVSASKTCKLWDGRTRTTVPWDGLHRDNNLWFEKGNCLVHLYGKGQSRRGAAFRVPLDEIQAAGFEALFSIFYNEVAAKGAHSVPSFDGTERLSKSALCDVYIPAPDYSSKVDSFAWHITTRNFFAFLFGKPLVGSSLSTAMIDLHERLFYLRAHDPNNHVDIMAYFERMGYLEFAHCPDYALAVLTYAEYFEREELWIDAFVHCVGMNGMLTFSSEFEKTSRITKALITRSYLEMDLHMGRVTKALSCFLEEDFSPVHLGLSSGARAHLERFRSFLHTYYVNKFGYWPPPKGTVFSKALCKSMYFDFRGLYDFLVDLDSTESLLDQKPVTGGICVLQNVQAFDSRHKYIPLPHPHPLLPDFSNEPKRSQSQRALLSLKVGLKQAKTERYISARDALFAATNSADHATAHAPLVQAYKRFERQCTLRPEEKVSMTDGRKVRWLLIYGIIQMLVSVIRAPKEVRDVDSPTYPLCCLVAETFPWQGGAKALNDHYTESINTSTPGSPGSRDGSMSAKPLPSPPVTSIQPDCETDGYFSHTSFAPSSTVVEPPATRRRSSLIEVSTIRRRSTMFRTSSFRSVKGMSFASVGVGRRGSQSVKPTPANFCEILVHGYGNGLNQTVLAPATTEQAPSELSAEVLPEIVVSSQTPPSQSPPAKKKSSRSLAKRRTAPGRLITPGFGAASEPSRTPTLDSFDVDKVHEPPALEDLDSPSDNSNSAPLTPVWSRSTSPECTVDRRASAAGNSTFSTSSTLSTNSVLLTSPIEAPKRSSMTSGITIQQTFSVDSFVHKEWELHEALDKVQSESKDENVAVYQPSGAPLRKRDALPSLRKRSEKSAPKGNLKRSDAVAGKAKRLSVRIAEGTDLFGVLPLPATVV